MKREMYLLAGLVILGIGITIGITVFAPHRAIEYRNEPPPVLFTNSMDTTDVAVSADDLYLWLRNGRFLHFYWKSNGRGGYQLQAPTINPDTIGLSDSIARADSIARSDSGDVGR